MDRPVVITVATGVESVSLGASHLLKRVAVMVGYGHLRPSHGSVRLRMLCTHISCPLGRVGGLHQSHFLTSSTSIEFFDRGVASINKLYGNKMAVLAGDFLLARASVSLARLRDVEVVELLSTVIEHLVKGEVSRRQGP
jgi:hypothetical protein